MRKRVNISVSPDTELLLKAYAKEHHTTVSQAITDWIWSEKEASTKYDCNNCNHRICGARMEDN